MKFFLLSICLILLSFPKNSHSQDFQQTIKGNVVDKDSKSQLTGVVIVVVNTNPVKGAISDIDGKFRIEKVPVGRQTIKVTFIGYKDVIIPEILVSTGKEVDLNIELEEKITSLETVEIKADKDAGQALNSMATISARSLEIDDASRYAGGFGDVARMASSFAGVATADDQNNEIVIRGNSPRGLLWRMEGIDIPNPNHFSNGEGDSGGGISLISNNVLDNSDFFTGAFPAEYGNALSGVLDLHLRKGNAEKREYAAQFGILGTEITLEGPFAKNYKGSYLINYRYSNFTLLDKIGISYTDNKNEVIPVFQDLAFNFYLPTKNAGNFSLFCLAGKSNAGQRASQDSNVWNYRSDRFEEDEFHKTGIFGLSHTYFFNNKKTYLRSLASFTYEENEWLRDSLNDIYVKNPTHNENISYPAYRVSVTLNHKFNSKYTFRTGAVYDNLNYNMKYESVDWEGDKTYKEYLNTTGSSSLYQLFAEVKSRLSENTDLVTGMHYLYFALNQHQSFEPRVGLCWRFHPLQSLNFGLGLHSRIETISNYMVKTTLSDGSEVQLNRELNFSRAAHAVIGYDNRLTDALRFKIEAYYQYLYNIPVEKDKASYFSAINAIQGIGTFAADNNGIAYNYGSELTLERFFSNNYYFLITVSLFDSKYRGSDEIWRNTLYNSNYITNWLIGKDFKSGKFKQNVLSLNIKFIIKGGNRYTPIDLQESIVENREVIDTTQIFNKRAPDYVRLDFGIKYRWNFKKASFIASLDMQNITDHKNIYRTYYDIDTKKVKNVYLNGLIPILNFRVEF